VKSTVKCDPVPTKGDALEARIFLWRFSNKLMPLRGCGESGYQIPRTRVNLTLVLCEYYYNDLS